MREWKKVKLKDIFIEGSKERVEDTSKYQKLTIKLNFKGMEKAKVREKMADRRPFYVRRKGEIVIGKQNYFNGSIAILPEELDGGICSNAIMSFNTKEDYNSKYIYYMLSDINFINKRSFIANGTGQKELSEKDFLNFEVMVPPIEEQEKIVGILDNAHKIIKRIEINIKDLEKMKQLVIKKCIYEGKMNCKKQKLGDLCKIYGRIGYRGYTVKDIVGKEQNGAISLSPGNIVNNKLFLEREKIYISNFKYEESPEIKIFNGDIIFVKTGSSYGKVAIVEGLKEKATLNPQLVVLKDIICDSRLLSEILGTRYVKKQVDKCISGGIVPTLTQKEMESYKIYIPKTNEEQLKLSNFTKKCDIKIQKLQELKKEYIKIKEALMQKLLTGKVRVKI